MLNLPLFFPNFQWRIYWILFQNTYITFLITHPAPLISIHSNSANTHGRGCAGTGPRETHGRFRTSLGTALRHGPASSASPLPRSPGSGFRCHCPGPCSLLSGKRRTVNGVSGPRAEQGPRSRSHSPGAQRLPARRLRSRRQRGLCAGRLRSTRG